MHEDVREGGELLAVLEQLRQVVGDALSGRVVVVRHDSEVRRRLNVDGVCGGARKYSRRRKTGARQVHGRFVRGGILVRVHSSRRRTELWESVRRATHRRHY